ncbi:MAG: DUF2062 domain-containing protein [Gammaproteobacteria bacterium]|nr:DUF2062 domain-containing protein [Gammaproteobacteria bacterium]
MPRRFIKRYMPDHDAIRNHKHLQFLGTLLHDPNILHLNRRSVSGAFSVGLFMAFVPVPFQMVLAALGAIVARVNLPISVGLVWITNPLTMPPIFYFAYKVGTWILDTPTREIHFQLSVEWLTRELGLIWQPFLLGCLVLGVVSAVLGNLLVRGLWRLQVRRNWRRRQGRRAKKFKHKKTGNAAE